MDTSKIIQSIAFGDYNAAKEAINSALLTKAATALEGKKIEVAQNLYNSEEIAENKNNLKANKNTDLGNVNIKPISYKGKLTGNLEDYFVPVDDEGNEIPESSVDLDAEDEDEDEDND